MAFTVVLDACVLVNARVRDTTLRAAEAGLYLWDLDPGRIAAIIREQAQALKRPPMTIEEILDRLSQFVPRFVRQIREHVGE